MNYEDENRFGGRQPRWVNMNPHLSSVRADDFRSSLLSKVVDQNDGVNALVDVYDEILGGMADDDRPLGVVLFLGPTGSGKTRVVEAAVEALVKDRKKMVKIDCAEFQHSHEIAKLIGSPPGYLGHRETSPLLTQTNIDNCQNDDKITFVLFDEIEKASESLWQLLLGILDRASLNLGDNKTTRFNRCVIVMTSNLGAKEMTEAIDGAIGFAPGKKDGECDEEKLHEKLERIAIEAGGVWDVVDLSDLP